MASTILVFHRGPSSVATAVQKSDPWLLHDRGQKAFLLASFCVTVTNKTLTETTQEEEISFA